MSSSSPPHSPDGPLSSSDDAQLQHEMNARLSAALEENDRQNLEEAQRQYAEQQPRDEQKEPSFDLRHDLLGDKTFMTGVDSSSNLHQQQQTAQQQQDQEVMRLSDQELLEHVHAQMMEYERGAQYLEAEKARQHLEALKARFSSQRRDDLERVQQEDVQVFFSMVAQHQRNFDAVWAKKTLEHKLRSDDLIDGLKWKHEDQQRELYEQLRKKKMPKFSVDLLNLRKRQILLAKAKNYVAAEKVKRKGDMLEAIEIERIRAQAREENQQRFALLLKKQEVDRQQLHEKLKLEKKCLLEAKAQDFMRLKKRLKNAEQELKKTHVRQQLLSEKKLLPLYSYATTDERKSARTNGGSTGSAWEFTNSRGNVLRNSGLQTTQNSSGKQQGTQRLKSARELLQNSNHTYNNNANGSSYYSSGKRSNATTNTKLLTEM